jgi:two-component system, LytTR family, response regulator
MENEISILIVEDEEIWVEQLHFILNEFGFTVTKTVSNADDALAALSACKYDLVLLDIYLNGKKSGIELGRIINKLYKKPFIFTTASQQQHQMKEAAGTMPSAYLTKPVNPASLFIAIQNAINNFSNNQTASLKGEEPEFVSFFVKHGNKYKKIDWVDVAFLSAGKNYTSVFNSADKTEYYIRSSLQKILQYQVPKQLQKQFLQVNRSEAVQLSFVQEVTNSEVKTAFKSFAVSETYSKELKSKLNIIS